MQMKFHDHSPANQGTHLAQPITNQLAALRQELLLALVFVISSPATSAEDSALHVLKKSSFLQLLQQGSG